jgi:hypothetical protein
MTTNSDMDRAVESATQILRRRVDEIEAAENAQPERLAKARSDAEVARGWALLEEPLDGQITSIASTDGTALLSLPNITARELWGARLAFDLLDCGDSFDQIDAVVGRLFSSANGDTGITMTIMSAALSTIAALVVPQLFDTIEQSGSDYDERARLCEARARAWHGRVIELRGPQDEAAERGVKPVDGFDIGAQAIDPEDESW